MPLLCHFIVFIKSLSGLLQVTKTHCALFNIQRVTGVFYFSLEVPNLKFHRDMTFYNFLTF